MQSVSKLAPFFANPPFKPLQHSYQSASDIKRDSLGKNMQLNISALSPRLLSPHSCVRWCCRTFQHIHWHIMSERGVKADRVRWCQRGNMCPCCSAYVPVASGLVLRWCEPLADGSASRKEFLASVCVCVHVCVRSERWWSVFPMTARGMSHLLNVAFTPPPVCLCVSVGKVNTPSWCACVWVYAHLYSLQSLIKPFLQP